MVEFILAFHHVGLSKRFLQSLLAFCPPPSSSTSIYVNGGGHTVNGALLASLCKTHVKISLFIHSSKGGDLSSQYTTFPRLSFLFFSGAKWFCQIELTVV